MSRTIDDISDAYVERAAALDPVGATFDGVQGHDAELTDYSPDGAQARADLDRTTLAQLAGLEPSSDRDARAARAMREKLEVYRDHHDAGEHLRDEMAGW